MKLKDFLNFIKKNNINPELELIISLDVFGNNFSMIDEAYIGNYQPFNSLEPSCGEACLCVEQEDSNAIVFYPKKWSL